MKDLRYNLAAELLKMSELDKKMRNKAQLTNQWDIGIDEQNTARLKEIVIHGGWPKISVVGKKASNAAWLLVQHADHNPDFQIECLKIMKQLPKNEVSQKDVAYLEDRVRVNTYRPQHYGTQFYSKGDTFGPKPIEDEINLDKRRRKVGLKPFAKYKTEIEKTYSQH